MQGSLFVDPFLLRSHLSWVDIVSVYFQGISIQIGILGKLVLHFKVSSCVFSIQLVQGLPKGEKSANLLSCIKIHAI